MSHRLPVSPAPGPLESYAQAFDDLFAKRTQRDAFRRYLGLQALLAVFLR